MIRFLCDDCGRRVSVSDELAGQSGKCPDCGSAVVVPVMPTPADIELDIETHPIYADADETTDGEGLKQEFFNDLGLKPIGLANLEAGKRDKPWYIDIFLYPISTSGISNMAMMILLPPLFSIIAMLLVSIPILSFFGFFFMMFNFIIRIYFFWYAAECVRYSCMGQTRAPSVYSSSGGDFWDVMGLYFSLLVSHLLCFGPAVIALIAFRRFGIEYWLLTTAGCLFFPILYLSIIVIDSISSWNPYTLIISMIRLMPQYLILSAVLMAVVWLLHMLAFWIISFGIEGFGILQLIKPIITAVGVYFSFIAAHLLGRFYWKNAHKLDW